MGVSTDALLGFGFSIDPDEYDIEHDRMYEIVNEHYGKKSHVEVTTHCHCDYPMLLVVAAGTLQRANRGYPVKAVLPTPSPTAEQRLRKFIAEELELDLDGVAPAWLLCSDADY